MARRKAEKPGRRLLRRLGMIAGIIAILVFTIEGGEYGTRDLWSQKGRRARLDAEVAQLKLDVDSLRLELKTIRTDDVRLERIAREKYGMVRGDKELLFWVGEEGAPSTSAPDAITSKK